MTTTRYTHDPDRRVLRMERTSAKGRAYVQTADINDVRRVVREAIEMEQRGERVTALTIARRMYGATKNAAPSGYTSVNVVMQTMRDMGLALGGYGGLRLDPDLTPDMAVKRVAALPAPDTSDGPKPVVITLTPDMAKTIRKAVASYATACRKRVESATAKHDLASGWLKAQRARSLDAAALEEAVIDQTGGPDASA